MPRTHFIAQRTEEISEISNNNQDNIIDDYDYQYLELDSYIEEIEATDDKDKVISKYDDTSCINKNEENRDLLVCMYYA